jgi:hypothetical protein
MRGRRLDSESSWTAFRRTAGYKIVGMLRTIALFCALAASVAAQDHTLGYDNTPSYPGSKWRVHDVSRPRPEVVTPGACDAPSEKPPSDAEILFDGTDLSKWTNGGKPPGWKVENGYAEIVPGQGNIFTKEEFGDIQLHLQWETPSEVKGNSQGRGNSGVLLMTRYEVQVLDSFDNPTYADGQAAAVYGQYPPLVNASCRPGQWQTYDIAFEAPRFEGDKLVKPAYVTVFQNGVLVQNHVQILGTTPHAQVGKYAAHSDAPLELQNHGNPDRYRNIWIRRLKPVQ